jgi:hypothetical protein
MAAGLGIGPRGSGPSNIANSRVAAGRIPQRLITRALVHVALTLAFLLPGGLVWNRLDPWILGLPFSVFVEALLLPLLIFANAVLCVVQFWQQDLALMEQLRRGKSLLEAEESIR